MDVFAYVRTLFGGAWEILTTIKMPGTEIPIAGIMIGGLCVVLSLRLISFVMGFRFSGKGGNNKNIKVSVERKDDTY